ncbi:MAG: GIY-YIG nuclease family protein [Rhodospirillaceae bacterium]|nr:GIY-YIG nuclease family protein [Rhodospirillaceae bacterium]
MPGIVYLLTNEAMPGLVKIGKTTQDDPQVRMDQLYKTNVPVPFHCVLAVRLDDPGRAEKALHQAFRPNRINPKREFFKIDPEQAVAALSLAKGEDVTPTVNQDNNAIPRAERASSEILRARRPNLNFIEMGIEPGSVLEPTSGEETAVVLDERRVRFRDREMSLTEATREREDLTYNVAPTGYWRYNGRSLREIYTATYPLDDQ